MNETFYIVGPTGVGKSEVAAEVARRVGAEIIGADAFQVYEGFDLLTAKPTAEVRSRAPHWLIGVVPATEEYSVARYLKEATRRREEIWTRGRLALVVGGTGLYVKALTHGLSTLPAGDAAIRAELETLDLGALNARLDQLDPAAGAFIDRHNKRRLVRAIEVCLVTGGRFSDHRDAWAQSPSPPGVLLLRDRADLACRINARVDAMFNEGVAEEVREAPVLGATACKMIGFEPIQQYLAGVISELECREQIALATRQYAKRQLTWFKRERSFCPINLSTLSFEAAVEQVIAASRRAD